jgi:DNA-binding Lrp family transcriptional regulator
MTTRTPNQRQQQIMEWLQSQRALPIDELASRLAVSAMTVHRDLDQLVKAGLVQKVYGAVELVETRPTSVDASTLCSLCHVDLPQRTAFVIHISAHEHVTACCPHCGLLLLQKTPQAISALTRDFIYGRMVNVMQAVYVFESRVQLCCVPSVLCFTSLDDAQAFQRGFDGEIMRFEQALAQVTHRHQHQHQHSA